MLPTLTAPRGGVLDPTANKKLETGEAEREKALLENIGDAIKKRISEQHKEALKLDTNIDKNIDKKVEQVSSLITSHIVNGNDIKLLGNYSAGIFEKVTKSGNVS
jgi:bifunctional ADP-heptose synthase (sugar kinase/adenylyltransferase)